MIYIGSTTVKYLSTRKAGHKGSYNKWLNGKGSYLTSFELFKLGPVNIELLELYPCSTKKEQHQRERFYIENTLNVVNKQIPTRDYKDYRKTLNEKQKNKIANFQHEYYEKNKDKKKEYNKQYSKLYYNKNKEAIMNKSNVYYRKNKEKIAMQSKERYEKKSLN